MMAYFDKIAFIRVFPDFLYSIKTIHKNDLCGDCGVIWFSKQSENSCQKRLYLENYVRICILLNAPSKSLKIRELLRIALYKSHYAPFSRTSEHLHLHHTSKIFSQRFLYTVFSFFHHRVLNKHD